MRPLPLFAFLLAGLLVALLVSSDASACGGFASRRRATEGELAKSLPFLTVEQVLVLWDKETGTEDFIRETRFEQANDVFGFVVPMPTKPEVSGISKAPFDGLRKQFAFEEPAPKGDLLLGGGGGSGGGARVPPVVVLSQQRIGSFTAFTLSTTDAGAFEKWLADNDLVMSAEAKPWLAHYVALKFFFVAFRYEPKGVAAATPAMTSETVRIRFKTPNPYYPYMEPAHAADTAEATKRMLTGWLVTRDPMTAVASRDPMTAAATRTPSMPRWVRPWVEGKSFTGTRDELAKSVGAEVAKLLPKTTGTFVVQPFRDLKTSRAGLGDVLFVPTQAKALSPTDADARKFLLGVVDPTLLMEDPKPLAPTVPSATPSATPTEARSGGCNVGVTTSSAPTGWLVVLGSVVLVVARRRRWAGATLVALALLGGTACRKQRPSDIHDAGATVSAPPVVVVTRAEREQNALAILAGEIPDGGIGWTYQPPPELPASDLRGLAGIGTHGTTSTAGDASK